MPSLDPVWYVRAGLNRVSVMRAAAREASARRALDEELRDPDLDIWPNKYNWDSRSDPVATPKRAPHRIPHAVRRLLSGAAAARRLRAARGLGCGPNPSLDGFDNSWPDY